MKVNFILIFASLFLDACGQVRETDSRSRKSITYNSYSSNPIELVKESGICYSKFSSFDLELKLVNGPLVLNLQNLLEGNYVRHLKKSVLQSSIYNHSIQYTVFKSLNGRTSYGVEQIRQPLDVTVCPNEQYSTSSVENAALITSYYINKTSEKVLEANPDLKISPIKLSIGPLIKVNTQTERSHDISQESSYWVDNASYMPQSQTISFYPQSQEAIRAGINTKFWQVPMVSSHEYAHHIFNQIFPYDLANKEISVCVDNRSHFDESSYAYSHFQVKDVINSYNEGFADLVAYYVLDETESSLKGLDCMEENREVGSPSFQDGSLKNLDEVNMYRIFSPWYRAETGNCRNPNFKDIHIVGAVFAHTTDTFLSSFGFSKKEKLQILIEWVKSIKSSFKTLEAMTAEEYFKATITDLIQKSQINGRVIEVGQCETIQSLYSGLKLKIKECSVR